MNLPERIVFYDGVCALCNATVRSLLWMDRQGVLSYAPLQGKTARQVLTELPDNLDAIVYWRQGQPLTHTSEAIGQILRDLRWPWTWASALLWVPRPLRDAVYRFIAKRRYHWFGKYDACPLPPPALRQRFLP
jgi:predicted DCC family thiol-disulfide oxidoreductase YuxK